MVQGNFVNKIDCELNSPLDVDIFYNFVIDFDEETLSWVQIERLMSKAQVEERMLEV